MQPPDHGPDLHAGDVDDREDHWRSQPHARAFQISPCPRGTMCGFSPIRKPCRPVPGPLWFTWYKEQINRWMFRCFVLLPLVHSFCSTSDSFVCLSNMPKPFILDIAQWGWWKISSYVHPPLRRLGGCWCVTDSSRQATRLTDYCCNNPRVKKKKSY